MSARVRRSLHMKPSSDKNKGSEAYRKYGKRKRSEDDDDDDGTKEGKAMNDMKRNKDSRRGDPMNEMSSWPEALKDYWETCEDVAALLSVTEGGKLLGRQ